MINLHWTVRAALNVVSKFCGHFGPDQFKSNEEHLTDLHSDVTIENLESKYGGTAPDVQPGQYWPPRYNL